MNWHAFRHSRFYHRVGGQKRLEFVAAGLYLLRAVVVHSQSHDSRVSGRGVYIEAGGRQTQPLHVAHQPALVGCGNANADRLPVQVCQRVNAGAVHRRELGRRIVVRGGGEIEDLLPRGRDSHRADAHVPLVAPIASRNQVPVRRNKFHLDAHPIGDFISHVHIKALEIAAFVQKTLWRIVWIGGDANRAAGHHCRQQVVRRGGRCASIVSRRSPGRDRRHTRADQNRQQH